MTLWTRRELDILERTAGRAEKLLGEEVNLGNFKGKAINRAAIGSDGSIFTAA